MKAVKVGICGLGTVGGGSYRVLNRNAALIQARAGRCIEVTHVGTRRGNPDCPTGDTRVSRDIFSVVDDPDIDFAQIAEDARPFSELCPAEHGSDVVRGLCLAHMQAHLKGDGEAADWLASDLGAVFDQRGIALAVE